MRNEKKIKNLKEEYAARVAPYLSQRSLSLPLYLITEWIILQCLKEKQQVKVGKKVISLAAKNFTTFRPCFLFLWRETLRNGTGSF